LPADFQELIEAGDLNALLRAVDALSAQRDWDGLIDLAERCEDALERGKQLWPIAAHIDYRLALEAPGPIAAGVLHSDVGRFALGPLTEVVASTHLWAEVADHIDEPHLAAYVGQERILRGENLSGDERAHIEVTQLPPTLTDWEPTYALATYKADHVDVAEPWEPRTDLLEVEAEPGDPVADEELTDALLDLVQPWTNESNGAARAAVVEGDAASAARSLTFGPLRMTELPLEEAMQRIAWAAASGGAHGRRRGAALGRFLTFFLCTIIVGETWPVDPAVLEQGLEDVRWFLWDEGEVAEEGWILRIAFEHDDGWAAAIAATDLLGEDDDVEDDGNEDADDDGAASG
jgi:hypothetical protein